MDLARSIEGATDFLLDARDERGWWRDFDTLAGASDEWVTAFVGTALAVAGDDRSMRAAWQAWRLLSRRRWWSAGWGYNALGPLPRGGGWDEPLGASAARVLIPAWACSSIRRARDVPVRRPDP